MLLLLLWPGVPSQRTNISIFSYFGNKKYYSFQWLFWLTPLMPYNLCLCVQHGTAMYMPEGQKSERVRLGEGNDIQLLSSKGLKADGPATHSVSP